MIPVCLFYGSTGLLCPACGNTRSIISLLDGDFIHSLSYNITPVVLALFALAFYIELLSAAFIRKIKIIPRSAVFLYVLIAIMIIYFCGRNFFPADI